jgi:hypothetical protein
MSAAAPDAAAPVVAAGADDPVYPLKMVFGWPFSRQRIRIHDARKQPAAELLIHLARPAWCEVWLGRRSGEPSLIIEAERFYTQSRTYRVLEPGGEIATIEYHHTVSVFEATFHLLRHGEAQPAFVIDQTPAGLLGQISPRYVVRAADGASVMELRLMDMFMFRHGTISRFAAPLDFRDEILCVLALSVVGISEFTQRAARPGD